MYINLHGYSTFSFLESVGKPKDIIKKAKELWQTAIALTDLNVMYGAIQHYQAGQEEGIKPLVGTEIGFVLDINNIQNEKMIGSLCLLAYTSQGYLNLLKLISYASQEGIAHRPKIDPHILKQHREGILIFTWGTESWIAKMLLSWEAVNKCEEIWLILKDIFWDQNCYLEIIAQLHHKHPEIAKINSSILELSEQTQTPCIVSNIYSYPSPKDRKTQELAMAIKDNLKLYDPLHRVPTTDNHIMSEQEIRAICEANSYSLDQINTWIENTQTIADRSTMTIEMGQALFPNYQGEPELIELYEKHKDELIISEP